MAPAEGAVAATRRYAFEESLWDRSLRLLEEEEGERVDLVDLLAY